MPLLVEMSTPTLAGKARNDVVVWLALAILILAVVRYRAILTIALFV